MANIARQQARDVHVLLREDQGPVAVLTLNRPEARNSLSEELIGAVTSAVKEIGGSDAVRAIVVTGAGTAFSSGHDLKELTAHRNDPDRGRAFFAKTMAACSDMMLTIVRSPKPVIAAVNGIATAAGCQLVASCDLAVASRGCALRHARRQYRPVLLDAHGRAQPQCLAQGGDGDAAARRDGRRARKRSRSVSSIAWCRRPRRQRGGRAWPRDRLEAEAHAEDRQGGVLPPARDAARRGLCLCFRGHGREHARCRGRGRHRRLHRQAPAQLAALSVALAQEPALPPFRAR